MPATRRPKKLPCDSWHVPARVGRAAPGPRADATGVAGWARQCTRRGGDPQHTLSWAGGWDHHNWGTSPRRAPGLPALAPLAPGGGAAVETAAVRDPSAFIDSRIEDEDYVAQAFKASHVQAFE